MKKLYVVLFLLFGMKSLAQSTHGFFLNEFDEKEATIPVYTELVKPAQSATATVMVDATAVIAPVSKYVYGNNANIYMSQMVDQPKLLDHIRTLSPQVIRFPGGNLSSVYFWNQNKNEPPADAPVKLVDANGVEQNPGYWYGKNDESWTLSVDNYYEMLHQTNTEGIITINYGYARYSMAADPVAAAAHLAADWVRYDNGRTKFWEIGNESNGTWQAGHRIKTADNHDEQPEIITGALYGKHFLVFADSMRKAAAEKGSTIYIGAQLLQEEPASWWNSTDKNWNTGIFQEAKNIPDYYIIHSYYTPYDTDSKAADILTTATTVTKEMMNYVTKAQTNAGVTIKPIALTEWNIFAVRSKQQVSYINGMHAVLVLGELIKNKYGLACRWDLSNAWEDGNDHGMFNSGDEPGGIPRWNPRAAFYYMYYFQKYMGDQLVTTSVTGSQDIISYASTFDSKDAGIVVVNKGNTQQIIGVDLKNYNPGARFYFYTLTGGTDNGEFSLKVFVNGQGPFLASGGPLNFETIPASSSTTTGGIKFSAPAKSVTYVLVEDGGPIVTGAEADVTGIVRIYPNPATGKFTIQLPTAGFDHVEMYDVTGNVVFQCELRTDQTTLELAPKVAPGIYLIRLANRDRSLFSKVIIE